MYRILIFSLFLLVLSQASAQERPNKVPPPRSNTGRILIVSGGGATGAWGGGVVETLHKQGIQYDAVIGSSTGSLIAPFVLTESFDELKEGYTGITDKDIFNVRPFKTKGKKRGQLRMWNALFRIISPKKTLGESKNLRKTIKRFFTQEEFELLRNSEKDFFVTVVNVLNDSIEYKSIHDPYLDSMSSEEAYNRFVNWIWASANFPVFMSLHNERDQDGVKQYYFDGGIKESIPLERGLALAREKGYRNIDVIIHSTGDPQLTEVDRVNKAMKLLNRTIDIFRSEVRENDVKFAESLGTLRLQGPNSDAIGVRIFYMAPQDYNLIPNQLLFDKDKMLELWNIGNQVFDLDRYQDRVVGFAVENNSTLASILKEFRKRN